MNRFAVLVVMALSVVVAACSSGGGGTGWSPTRYTVKVEDVGTSAPAQSLADAASVTVASSAFGCEGYTFSHVPTDAWGLEDRDNMRFIRATVFDRGEALQGEAVSWAYDSPLIRIVEERDNLLAIVPEAAGVARLTAAYKDSVAFQMVYIYDAVTLKAGEDEVTEFDLDGDGSTDIEVMMGFAHGLGEVRFPFGGMLIETPVDMTKPCSHHNEVLNRFYETRELPSEMILDSDWRRAETGSYILTGSTGLRYKLLVGLVGLAGNDEIILGIQYVAADSMGQFPY